jgi:hypothetical protein
LKRQGEVATSQKYTSDLERAEMGKELSHALEKTEALKFDLRTATTQKETSNMEKEEMGKQVTHSMEKGAALKVN